jgi:hypothetical protein
MTQNESEDGSLSSLDLAAGVDAAALLPGLVDDWRFLPNGFFAHAMTECSGLTL